MKKLECIYFGIMRNQFVAKTFYYYAIIGCIIPLTGWWGDYVMPFKFKCRLTKVKEYYE